jgi:regulatory protein
MKITAISPQQRNQQRVNISVDGKYSFSLDIFQVGELDIRIGKEYTEAELTALQEESEFGKAYGRAIELIARRPRSEREMEQYARKKLWSPELAERVISRLKDRAYLSDESFARFWVGARVAGKPISRRKLVAELRAKGVASDIIEKAMAGGEHDELEDLKAIIEKRRHRYDDEQKLLAYLARQGFSYEDIKRALSGIDDQEN